MWFQSYVLPLAFLLSTVSGLKNEQPINYIHVQMNVNCNGRIYTRDDLHTAAREACSRTSRQLFCRDYIRPFYIKKCIPAIPRVSLYKGPYYKDQETDGPLLKWPLPKRSLFERSKYSAIIYWNAETRQCMPVGAIELVRKTEIGHDQCKIMNYNVAKNENFVRVSTQRKKDSQHPQMNPTEMPPGGNQNEIPLPPQPSDSQPKLKTGRLNLARKFQHATQKIWLKRPGESNNVNPTDSGTQNVPEH